MRWGIAGAFAALVLASSVRADACSYGPLEPHALDENEKLVDTTPPSAIGKSTYTVERGSAPKRSGCSETSSSCDDTGTLTLYLGEVSDDRTPAAKLGYRVEVVAGTAPSNPTWPTAAVRAYDGPILYFHWLDGSDDEQESIDFTFRVRAVDLAGNEGPPTEIRIHDDGASDGCRVGTGGVDVSLPGFGAMAALFWMFRRRKRAETLSAVSRRSR